MRIFIKNIKKLINVRENTPAALTGEQLGILPCIEEGYLITDGDEIIDFGEMSELEQGQLSAIEQSVDKIIDATGKMVFPSYCDSHTILCMQAAVKWNSLTNSEAFHIRRLPAEVVGF